MGCGYRGLDCWLFCLVYLLDVCVCFMVVFVLKAGGSSLLIVSELFVLKIGACVWKIFFRAAQSSLFLTGILWVIGQVFLCHLGRIKLKMILYIYQ